MTADQQIFWDHVKNMWEHLDINLSVFRFQYERMVGSPITALNLLRKMWTK